MDNENPDEWPFDCDAYQFLPEDDDDCDEEE